MLDKVNGLYPKSPFTYDTEQDVYLCPGGEVLVRIGHTKASSRTCEQTLYACHVCTDCLKEAAVLTLYMDERLNAILKMKCYKR